MTKNMTRKAKYVLAFALTGALAASVCVPSFVRTAAADAGDSELKPNVYVSEYDNRSGLANAAAALDREILAEGAVMLKNEDNALPLAKGSKISVFGKNSTRYGYAGEFVSEGFEVNNALINFYNNNAESGSGRGEGPSNGTVSAGYNTGETPIESYNDSLKATFKDYNDAAIVVFYRAAGEGWDNPRTMTWDGESYARWTASSTQLVPGARAADDHYLQLDKNEADLLKMCGDNFKKVIVLLNTSSSFETGFLDDPGHYGYHENIKAAFFLGYPRNTRSVAKILTGEINPSGRTTDTWARDFKLDPSWQNFSNYLSEIDTDHKGNQYTNLPGVGGNGGGGYANNYVTYNEGIYVGYRYWETRGATEGNSAYTSAGESEKTTYLNAQNGGSAGKSKDYIHGTSTTSWDSWYDAHVVYPLGHGLSYTTFEQTIVSSEPAGNSALTKDGTITLNVKVKNTGTVAGKDVVQVYYTAPYKENGIEKSHVLLAAFEKTDLLEPQAEQTLALTFKVRDMASYDYSDANANGFKGYELDEGEYTVKLMKNAHEEIASVKYNVESNIQYKTDAATDGEIENRFDSVSDYITGELHQKYLSRNDWENTWPVFNKRLTASEAVTNGLHEWWMERGSQTRDPNKDQEQPYYTDQMPTTGAKNGIVLSDLQGKDYDDSMWDEYLDQFTVAQLTEIATRGGYVSGHNYPELGVKEMSNVDAPEGLVKSGGADDHYYFACSIVLASSWNRELAYRFGKMVGEDALWGSKDNIGAWYAPAVNIHRNQFAGRNWEYYSEDGLLAGEISAYVTKGAQEKGLPVYVKHFALNNAETNRCGLITWANEQAMREIYFKPFEISVKEGKALGIMSSLNRIGTTWAGGSYELLTEILRNEWGFEGCVVTDSYMGDESNLSNADQMIRAGGDLALGGGNLHYNVGTATTVAALRRATKNVLYAQVHSNALNSMPQGDHKPVESFQGAILERGVVGIPYSQNIANAKLSDVLYPDVDDSRITYTVSEGSKLPAGLTLSPQGKISGTPTEEANNYRFSVDATYAGYSRKAEFTISIIGSGGAIVYEAQTDLGSVPVGKAATFNVGGATVVKPDADGEVLPTCTYSLANGSALPAGLVLSSDGKITGTPTAVCDNYTFKVVASAMGYRSVTLTFTLSVHNEFDYEGGALPNGKIGATYLYKLPEAEGIDGATYALKEERLPNGLVLTKGGYIVGTPRETVTDYAFTVVVSAPFAKAVEARFTITVGLSFNDNALQSGRVGETYSAHVDTAQGAGEIAYALKEGSVLPEGLTLENGVISGTPQKAGDYTLTVVASADGKAGDEITLTLHIAEASAQGGGCGGVIGAGGAGLFVAVVAAAAVAVIWKRRGKEDASRGEENEK